MEVMKNFNRQNIVLTKLSFVGCVGLITPTSDSKGRVRVTLLFAKQRWSPKEKFLGVESLKNMFVMVHSARKMYERENIIVNISSWYAIIGFFVTKLIYSLHSVTRQRKVRLKGKGRSDYLMLKNKKSAMTE